MMMILDFQIQSTAPERYRLDVFARGQSPPLATAEFDYPLSFLTGFELNRLDFDNKDPVGRFERLQTFGHALYQKLFTADIQRLWQTHKDRSDFLVLCLRIAPEAAGLEALPWEALFDGVEFLEDESGQHRPTAVQEMLHALVVRIKNRRRMIGVHLQTMVQVLLEKKNHVCQINPF